MSKEIKEVNDSLIPIYTGVFLVNPVVDAAESKAIFEISPFHVTYDYRPGNPYFPDRVKEGDWTNIIHVGIYDDGDILASKVYVVKHQTKSQVEDGEFSHYHAYQSHNENLIGHEDTPLHITWDTNGLAPIEAGIRLSMAEDEAADNVPIEQSKYLKYYTDTKLISEKEHMNTESFKSLDLDSKDKESYKAYKLRLNPIFKLFNPIGIWKTYKSEPHVVDPKQA